MNPVSVTYEFAFKKATVLVTHKINEGSDATGLFKLYAGLYAVTKDGDVLKYKNLQYCERVTKKWCEKIAIQTYNQWQKEEKQDDLEHIL